MWSIWANMRRRSLDAAAGPASVGDGPLAGPHRGGEADVADRAAWLDPRHAGHDGVDLAALEHLVGEQLGGEALEQVAVALDERPRGAVGLEGELALLLVANAARQVRQGVRAGRRRLRRLVRAHRVVVDHGVRDLGDALEVVRRTGGHRPE